MARFLIRSVISTVVTMLVVSILLFFLIEIGGKDVTIQILGVFATPEQKESLRKQLGLDQPAWLRYTDWLIGNDWRMRDDIGYPLVQVENPQTGEQQWWQTVDGETVRWSVETDDETEEEILTMWVRQADGSTVKIPSQEFWPTTENEDGEIVFWGVDERGRAAKWIRDSGSTAIVATQTGVQTLSGQAVEWVPLRKGIIRGDSGTSLKTGRAVSATLPTRVRNTAVLASTAFIIVMPLALLLGIIAGINEGRFIDRFLSITGLAFTATPEFVTGVLLILVIGIYWSINTLPGLVDAGTIPEWLGEFLNIPAVSVFTSDDAIFENPKLLALPVMTLTLVELGYILRMTRASMVEVMNAAYIRTAIIKGMPFRRVVFRHAIRNALMAPITIMMLHINYLVGGVVVVEVIFGYPGLGLYIYESSIFGDPNAVEAAAMVTVMIAVATRLIGDFAYTLLNPRIRYS